MVAIEAAIAVAADVPLQATAEAPIQRRPAMVAAGPRTAVVERRTVADPPTAADRTAVVVDTAVVEDTVVVDMDMGGNSALDFFPA